MIGFVDELEAFAAAARGPVPPPRDPRKGGRPRLPAEIRTEPFSTRLTPVERVLVARAARLAGEASTATWARHALVEAARRLLAEERRRAV